VAVENAKVIPIRPRREIITRRDALRYGAEWRHQANCMEAALLLATAQRDASDLLLAIAEEELERLRALLGND